MTAVALLVWLDFNRNMRDLAEVCFNPRQLAMCGGWEVKIRLKRNWEFDV